MGCVDLGMEKRRSSCNVNLVVHTFGIDEVEGFAPSIH